MSEQNLSPRQKMINLMYLVLTAMLALNVDSAVIERFVYIDQTLAAQVSENSKRNSQTVQNIEVAVEDRGDRQDDLKVLERAKMVREATNEVIGYTKTLKEEIIQYSGGEDEEGNLRGAKDMDKIATYMIRQKRGDDLQQKLNSYVENLNSIAGTDFGPIANDGKNDPYFKNVPNQRNKDFKELMFESTPTAGGLASISQLMNQVLTYESAALERLADQVGAKDVSFDRIVPMVLPESKLVAAGAKYSAQLFISAASTGVTPSMRVDGRPIPVNAEGFGQIEFTATGGQYDKDGQLLKSFMAEIDLGDSTYRERIEYIVAKPVIQINSAAVQALYRNCGNELDVQVPALGSAYNPSFKVAGGAAIGGQGGKVTVVPTAPKADLSVYSNGQFIGTQSFRVKPIPKPEIVMTANGSEIDQKRGMSQAPREISLQAEADADFKQFLPNDARYRVTQWEVTLARGPRPIEQKKVSGPTANTQSFVTKARPGDRIVVEVKEVQRMNFQGERESVNIPVSSRIKQFPIE
jgi:gliding motility-associated protein GldM